MFNYNLDQSNAILDPGSVLVEASPGSGKTSTIIGRILHKAKYREDVNRKIAVITYTNAGVYEIEERLNNHKISNLFIGTIHSFCLYYILRPYYWVHKTPVKIISDEEIQSFYDGVDYLEKNISLIEKKEELSKIRRNIKGEIVLPNYLKSCNKKVKSFCLDYFKYKREQGLMDFNDILYLSLEILIKNKYIARVLANSFLEIMVDEFQDTSELQYHILKQIYDYEKTKLFLVGDPKQLIMRFAGAKLDSFDTAKNDFVLRYHLLREHYRSSSKIMNTYMNIYENHPEMINSSLLKELDSDFNLIYCNGNENCINNCWKCENDIEAIRLLIEHYIAMGIEEEEIAILSNWHLHAWKISNRLKGKYHFRGTGSFPHKKVNDPFYEIMIKYIKYIRKERSIYSYKQLRSQVKLCIEFHGIELEKSLNALTNQIILAFDDIDKSNSCNMGLMRIKDFFEETFGYEAEFIDSIIIALEKRCLDWCISDYFDALDYEKGIYNDTIHSSKGREFDVVILFKMDDNYLPHLGSNDPLDLFDAERKFYVGLSRAKKHISIVCSKDNPSRLLKRIN